MVFRVWLLLLVTALGSANDSRVDDDVRTYGVGIRSVLHTGDGDVPFEFDARLDGTVARPGVRPGRTREERREGRAVVVEIEERWLELLADDSWTWLD